MVPMPSGVCSVNRRLDRPFHKLATAGALALALVLAACGLRGPLDPPPAETPAQAQIDGQPQQEPQPQDDQIQPPRKRIFLDWLLD
jgi:predicted small lipoprotein YifL